MGKSILTPEAMRATQTVLQQFADAVDSILHLSIMGIAPAGDKVTYYTWSVDPATSTVVVRADLRSGRYCEGAGPTRVEAIAAAIESGLRRE